MVARRGKIAGARRNIPRCDQDPPTDRHGITGVYRQVENSERYLRRIDQSWPEGRSEHWSQFDAVLADRAPEHFGHPAHDGIQVCRLCGENLPASEGQELLSKLRAAPC